MSHRTVRPDEYKDYGVAEEGEAKLPPDAPTPRTGLAHYPVREEETDEVFRPEPRAAKPVVTGPIRRISGQTKRVIESDRPPTAEQWAHVRGELRRELEGVVKKSVRDSLHDIEEEVEEANTKITRAERARKTFEEEVRDELRILKKGAPLAAVLLVVLEIARAIFLPRVEAHSPFAPTTQAEPHK